MGVNQSVPLRPRCSVCRRVDDSAYFDNGKMPVFTDLHGTMHSKKSPFVYTHYSCVERFIF